MSTKKFLLDTSVIFSDSVSAFSFEDSRIAIPISVLEELDGFKKENKNYHSSDFIRFLTNLAFNNF